MAFKPVNHETMIKLGQIDTTASPVSNGNSSYVVISIDCFCSLIPMKPTI